MKCTKASSEYSESGINRSRKSQFGNRKSEIAVRKSEIGNRSSEIGDRFLLILEGNWKSFRFRQLSEIAKKS